MKGMLNLKEGQLYEIKSKEIGEDIITYLEPSDDWDGFKLTPWFYATIIMEEVRHKGGAGSGHHGHRGRPGKVGGSLPGKGSTPVTREWLLDNLGDNIYLDEAEGNAVIDVFVKHKIPQEHFEGLSSISSDNPSPTKYLFGPNGYWDLALTMDVEQISGVYNQRDGSIHLAKATLTDLLGSHKMYKEYAERTILHEFGHHVIGDIRVDRNVRNDAVKFVSTFIDFIGEYDYPLRAAQEYYGLREYSFTNEVEFFADSYVAYIFGDENIRYNLNSAYREWYDVPFSKMYNMTVGYPDYFESLSDAFGG